LKKRSGRKAHPPPPKPATVFVDRCLGSKKIPDGLRALGIVVEINDDHFSQDADDTAWLSAIGHRGWVVLTKDERIRRDPAEIAPLLRAGVHAIFLGRQDASADDMLDDLQPCIARLLRRFALSRKPLHVVVHKRGRVDTLKIEQPAPTEHRDA
jgi:hypothetical protein